MFMTPELRGALYKISEEELGGDLIREMEREREREEEEKRREEEEKRREEEEKKMNLSSVENNIENDIDNKNDGVLNNGDNNDNNDNNNNTNNNNNYEDDPMFEAVHSTLMEMGFGSRHIHFACRTSGYVFISCLYVLM